MDKLLSLEFLKAPQDTKIPSEEKKTIPPIPDPSFLKKDLQPIETDIVKEKATKYEREYDAFCQWAALPPDIRKPKTIGAFEKKWRVPKNYSSSFRKREDYQQKRMTYFYDWVMDLWPGLVHQAYKRAMKNSTADFKVLAEIINKTLDVNKPQVSVAPMVLVGVSQDKLDKLFTPKAYEDVPRIKDGEIVK